MSSCGTCGRALQPNKMRCTACGAYTTTAVAGGTVGESDFVDACDVEAMAISRIVTGMWWDKPFNGGFVPTSATLFGGSPGAGKTTLLFQIAFAMAQVTGKPSYYISAEQDKGEIKMTLDRLGLDLKPGMIRLLKTMGSGGSIDQDVLKKNPPGMFILDSLTALCGKDLKAQVDVGREYKKLAVTWKAPTFMISHITKEGDLAGLITAQHDCDTIASLFMNDNDRSKFSGKPVLCIHKNRFGPTNIDYQLIMKSTGLIEAPKKDGKYFFDVTCLDEIKATQDDLHEEEIDDRGRIVSIPSRSNEDLDEEEDLDEDFDEEDADLDEENLSPAVKKELAKNAAKNDAAREETASRKKKAPEAVARDIRAVVPKKVPLPVEERPYKPTAAERAAETYRKKYQTAEARIAELEAELAGRDARNDDNAARLGSKTLEPKSKRRKTGAVKSKKASPKKRAAAKSRSRTSRTGATP
jgi:hypothetical protein